MPEGLASLALPFPFCGATGIEGARGGLPLRIAQACFTEQAAAVHRGDAVKASEIGEGEPGGRLAAGGGPAVQGWKAWCAVLSRRHLATLLSDYFHAGRSTGVVKLSISLRSATSQLLQSVMK
jgi:hypothetical protein